MVWAAGAVVLPGVPGALPGSRPDAAEVLSLTAVVPTALAFERAVDPTGATLVAVAAAEGAAEFACAFSGVRAEAAAGVAFGAAAGAALVAVSGVRLGAAAVAVAPVAVVALPFEVLAVAAFGVAAAAFVAPVAEAVAGVAAVLAGAFAGLTAVLGAGLTGLTLGGTAPDAFDAAPVRRFSVLKVQDVAAVASRDCAIVRVGANLRSVANLGGGASNQLQ